MDRGSPGLRVLWKESVSKGAGRAPRRCGVQGGEEAAVTTLGNSGFWQEPQQGLTVATLSPKHSLKSGPLGEDFCLLAQPCQASWDLRVEGDQAQGERRF